jgi:hypothetical protein
MTDANRIAELQRVLDMAKAHLARATEEYERFDPPGMDYRQNGRRLRLEMERAANDVAVLERALRDAEHSYQAFELAPADHYRGG